MSRSATIPASSPRCVSWGRDFGPCMPPGKLHRDVKPANILVTAAGRVVLLDFGPSCDAAEEEERGLVVGTPQYMSPEQLAGQEGARQQTGTASAFCFLRSPDRPLAAPASSLGELVAARRSRDPVPPRTVHPAVPIELDALCMQLLRAVQPPARLANSSPGSTDAPPAPTPAPRPTQPLIGRQTQLQLLTDTLQHVKEGHPALALLRGLPAWARPSSPAPSFAASGDGGEPPHPGGPLL